MLSLLRRSVVNVRARAEAVERKEDRAADEVRASNLGMEEVAARSLSMIGFVDEDDDRVLNDFVSAF